MINTEIRNTTRAASAGLCIYCGRTDGLTDEHIVPFGLGGNLILPDASCGECNKITSAFEHKVLRGFMRDARTAGGFQTRRPKDRPATIPISIKQDGQFKSVQVPSSEAFGMLMLPKLGPAAFLAGGPPAQGVNIVGTQMIGFGKHPKELAESLDTKTLQGTAKVDATSFVRMLAKIGYSYAVTCTGPYPLNEVPVLPLIQGKSDDGSTWVGSADYRLDVEDRKPQHALGLVSLLRKSDEAEENVFVARVKLFADSGATGYEIVVRRTRA
jgi:hypothetical protein